MELTGSECSSLIPLLAERIAAMIKNDEIVVNTDSVPWQSGVYSLIDCVFSAQAIYKSVVLPMLKNRLALRPGLADHPDLAFSAFVADVDAFGKEKFERYATEILTRQVLARRRKVEVCYDSALFFVERGFETRKDLRAIGEDALERLILVEFRGHIHGVGEALSRYLLMRLGSENHIKPDVKMLRFFNRLSDWKPRLGDYRDAEIMRSSVLRAAEKLSITAVMIDEAVWNYETR
jgi:hypothetical protein